MIRDRGYGTVVGVLCAWSQRKSVFLEKMSGKTIKKAQMDVTGGFDITFIRA